MTSVEVVEGREDGLISCLDDYTGVARGVEYILTYYKGIQINYYLKQLPISTLLMVSLFFKDMVLFE